MNFLEFQENLNRASIIINQNDKFFTIVDNLSMNIEHLPNVLVNIQNLSTQKDQSKLNKVIAEQSNLYQDIKQTLSEPSIIFSLIDRIIHDFREQLSPEFFESRYFSDFILVIESFTKSYDRLLVNMFDEITINSLINISSRLSNIIKRLSSLTISVKYFSHKETPANYTDFFMAIYSNQDFNTITSKLECLENIYNESCYLFNISDKEFPLIIDRLEYGGGFIAALKFATKIAKFIPGIFSKTMKHFHAIYWETGKLEVLSKKYDILDRHLKFTKDLKALGAPMDETKEKLGKFSIILSENLNKLFYGEPSVQIDGELFDVVNEEDKKKLLKERKKMPKLLDKNPQKNPDTNKKTDKPSRRGKAGKPPAASTPGG